MSTQIDESLVIAAQQVHNIIWHRHWKEGQTSLRASQVIGYIRDVRTKANCTEQQLPKQLQDLLLNVREDDRQTIGLHNLLVPLKTIVFTKV